MSQKSFAELEKISRKQSETIKQQNEILANQARDLQMKASKLEMEAAQMMENRHADIRHQVNQCVDFAIWSLPWWKRGVRNVVDTATEYLLTIKRETAKHVAMEEAVRKIQEEKAAEEIKQDDAIIAKGIVDTVSHNQNGSAEIHATMDRESAELEHQ